MVFFMTLELPGEPINLFVTRVEDKKISFMWSPPTHDGGSKITGYQIEILEVKLEEKKLMEPNLNSNLKWKLVENVDANTVEYTIKNLNSDGMYSIRVAAENSSGLGKFKEIQETIIAKNMSCEL